MVQDDAAPVAADDVPVCVLCERAEHPDRSCVEAEFGFTFGGGPVPVGDTVAVVQCVNPSCGRRSQMVQVFEGHPDPVHCGGCFAVLHCDHLFEDRVRHEGSLGAAVEVRETVCSKCGLVSAREKKPIVLRVEDLPVSALTALLNS